MWPVTAPHLRPSICWKAPYLLRRNFGECCQRVPRACRSVAGRRRVAVIVNSYAFCGRGDDHCSACRRHVRRACCRRAAAAAGRRRSSLSERRGVCRAQPSPSLSFSSSLSQAPTNLPPPATHFPSWLYLPLKIRFFRCLGSFHISVLPAKLLTGPDWSSCGIAALKSAAIFRSSSSHARHFFSQPSLLSSTSAPSAPPSFPTPAAKSQFRTPILSQLYSAPPPSLSQTSPTPTRVYTVLCRGLARPQPPSSPDQPYAPSLRASTLTASRSNSPSPPALPSTVFYFTFSASSAQNPAPSSNSTPAQAREAGTLAQRSPCTLAGIYLTCTRLGAATLARIASMIPVKHLHCARRDFLTPVCDWQRRVYCRRKSGHCWLRLGLAELSICSCLVVKTFSVFGRR